MVERLENVRIHFGTGGQIRTNRYNVPAILLMSHEQQPMAQEPLRVKDRCEVLRSIERTILPIDCQVIATLLIKDPTIAPHLDSLPVPNSSKPEDIQQAAQEIVWYYKNKSDHPDVQSQILPLVARNVFDDMLGVLTIRWEGDRFIPKSALQIASIEGLLVDPKERRQGIATRLLKEALHIIFEEQKYDEVRAWVLTDAKAGNYQPNIDLFLNRLHFSLVADDPNAALHDSSWKDYQKKRGIDVDDRSAIWFCMKREKYFDLLARHEL